MQNIRETKESTSMNTDIKTVGAAMIVQQCIRWVAIFVIFWLALSFVDSWVRLALVGGGNG